MSRTSQHATVHALIQHLKQVDQSLAAWIDTVQSPDHDPVMAETTLAEWCRVFTALQTTNADLVVRRVTPPVSGPPVLLVYLSSLVDENRLASALPQGSLGTPEKDSSIALTGWGAVPVTRASCWGAVVMGYLAGKVVVFVEGFRGANLVDLADPPAQAVGRANTEQSIRGPQEGFAEVMAVQLGQLRRRMPSPDLVVEDLILGLRIPNHLGLVYLKDLVQPDLVAEVKRRLTATAIDSPSSATRVGAVLRDHPWAIFPTVRYSERVDLVALELEQGKVAVFVNGDPFVLTVPATLADFYRTSADYSSAWYDASFLRVIRFLGWGFGIFLPAIYIALTEVNPDLISSKLFDLVAGSHTGLPFTPLVEVVVMILVIEILREAAIRLPKILASTIGTVGAIVIGTAVVKAGFVSAQIIVLMTLTALSLFSVPTYELIASWRVVGWIMLMSAFLFGVYGLVLAVLWMTVELVSIQSFGTPYLVPWSPFRPKDWQNTLWRLPWAALTRRLTEGRARHLRWQSAHRPRR